MIIIITIILLFFLLWFVVSLIMNWENTALIMFFLFLIVSGFGFGLVCTIGVKYKITNEIKIEKKLNHVTKCDKCDRYLTTNYCPDDGTKMKYDEMVALQTKDKDTLIIKFCDVCDDEEINYDTIKTIYRIYYVNYYGRVFNYNQPKYVADTIEKD